MSLETATYVANLVVSNPDGSDQRNTADDHLRLIKAALVRTFPKLDSAVSLSSSQVMYLGDLSASVQLQLNQLRDGSATANNALYANSASYAAKASRAESASYAALAGRAESASYATFAGTATLALAANSASYAALAGLAATATNATNATNANNAANAAFALTCTSAGSAALLTGLPPHDAATANTIAQRTANGDLYVRYINQSSALESISVGGVMVVTDVANGNNFVYKCGLSTFGSYLDARNVSTKNGTNKTLSSSAPTALDGFNGDIWYQY